MFTAFARFAIVVRAHIVVIAVDRATSDARTGNALIRCGAEVVVIAGRGVWCMNAAVRVTARIICTWVAVVALECCVSCALSVQALVAGCANVAVRARFGVVGVCASLIEVARVIRAWIAIITDGIGWAGACAAATDVSCGAFIAIVAWERVGHMLTSFFRIA